MSFNDFLNEKRKVTLKRRYTENHPALEAGVTAKVRNKMIEAVADGKLTQEEFKSILSELSADTGRWMRRNAKYFNVSEDGITLSKFGKRVLNSVVINENEELITESTRAHVGIIDKNGKIHSTYIHSDGYLDGVGDILKKHYKDTNKIKKLIDLGKYGISYLAPEIEGGQGHSFNSPIRNQTVFYGRDRGQKKHKYDTRGDMKDLEDYLSDASFSAEYIYLWDEKTKKWMYAVVKTDIDRENGLQLLEKTNKPNMKNINEAKKVSPYELKQVLSIIQKFNKQKKDPKKMNSIFWPDLIDDISYNLDIDIDEDDYDFVIAFLNDYYDEKSGELEVDKHDIQSIADQMRMANESTKSNRNNIVFESFSDFVANLNENQQINEWGSSDTSIMNKEIHKQAGSPKTMPSPFDTKLRNAAEDAVDFYWSDWEEYQNDRDGLIDNAVRSYLNQYFKEEFRLLQRMFEGSEINEYWNDNLIIKDVHDTLGKPKRMPSSSELRDAVEEVLYQHAEDGDYEAGDADIESTVSKYLEKYFESVDVNEAFKSAKLQQLLRPNERSIKDLAPAFYDMSKIALDKVEDADLIDGISPREAHALDKSSKGKYVIFYIVDQEKENPYAPQDAYHKTIKPGIIAIVKGSKFQGIEWAKNYGIKSGGRRTLRTTDGDGVGVGKKYKGWDGTGLYNAKRISDVADRAIMIDIDVLKDKYSTTGKIAAREAAKKGAIAFKNDKDFRDENMKRYKEILANKAAALPLDKMVKDAIDMLTDQIKLGLEDAQVSKYGEAIIGMDPRGRTVSLRDASNHMSNILSDYADYVKYSIEKHSSVSNYYEEQMKRSAMKVKERINKIPTMDYVW